jgi:hypothetical protein
MTELERSLAALAAEVDWPETPAFALPREQPRPAHRARVALLAAVVAALAVGIAFAVPPARSAILRLLGFGGVTIERVSTLPAARERPLATGLGAAIGRRGASQLLGEPVRLPAGAAAADLYAQDGVVSALLDAGGPLLLGQFRAGAGVEILKKLASASTRVEWLEVEPGVPGVWIDGGEHVFFGPAVPPRLAGHVLIWQRGEITYRLEGRTLTRARALALARQIDG